MEKHNLSDWIEAGLSRIGLGSAWRKEQRIKRLEKKTGADFGGKVVQEDMGYKKEEGNDYTASPDSLLDLCRDHITGDEVIMDLGCGKGYAMYLMGKFPFSAIYGVEKSDMLSRIAEQNLRKCYPSDTRFQLFTIDATKMLETEQVREALDSCSHIYIYNSFPRAVAQSVFEELEESVHGKPRKLTIWYASPSPECLEIPMNSSCFSLSEHYQIKRHSIYEFVNTCNDRQESMKE